MKNIAIGISVYNNSNNLKNLVCSILSLTDYSNYKIVVCDDGSPDVEISDEIQRFCKSLDIPLVRNITNKGVPFSWNHLSDYYDYEYVIILNDDTRVIDPNWLRKISFFLDKNPTVGIVDWREKVIDSRTGKLIRYTTKFHDDAPRFKLKPSGPFFALRKSVLKRIKQPDGSIGFWEDLMAYREELDIAAEFYERGFYVAQLPFYMEHFKSQTFSLNNNIKFRKQYSKYLPKSEYFGEYLKYARIRKETSLSKIEKLKLWLRQNSKHDDIELPLKIEYSRAMFAKKWKHRSLFGYPGDKYLNSVVEGNRLSIKHPETHLHFLNKNLDVEKTFV